MPKSKSKNKRGPNQKSETVKFLIVCEGKTTEPRYFRGFRVNANVHIVGLGKDIATLTQEAIKLSTLEEYDYVWCVFDKDENLAHVFNEAIRQFEARGGKYRVAYSNECFELWYILHFQYLVSGIPRAQYFNILDKFLEKKYQKNEIGLYHILLSKQNQAIANAKRLAAQYPNHNPALDNPYTKVYELVELLNAHLIP
jgi:hypothetical protein